MVINLSEPRTYMNTRSTIDICGITKRTITLNAADVTDQIIGYVRRSSANKVLIVSLVADSMSRELIYDRDNARDNDRASETIRLR